MPAFGPDYNPISFDVADCRVLVFLCRLTVLKSSASASDADSDAKTANAICQCFTRRILPLLFPATQ